MGKADIFIKNDEFLYGGNNGWFYGIWKSVWQEDMNGVFREKHPFSVKGLRSLVTEAEGMNEDEFNEAKANKKAQNVDDPKRSVSETDVHFSLPETKENSYQVKELKDLKNNAVSYHVDFEKSLLGIVAVTTKLVKDDKGKKTPVTEYYMPFIYGDVIHADRAGGNTYYEIEGIGKPGNGKNVVQNEYSNLVIPTIRKTYTEGTDKTPNLSMGFGGTAKGAVEGAKILDEAKDKLPRIIEGGAGGSLSAGKNTSDSYVKQACQDINGDGLQDVLEMSPGGKAITVKYNTGNSFVAGDAIALPDWSNYVKGNIEKFLNNTDSKGYDLGFVSDIPVVGATVSKSLAVVSVNPFGCFAEKYTNSLDWSSSTTIGFSTSAGANASTTINGTSVRMMDLDGDGLADHVLRVPGVGTYWKHNISGLYGKLNRIDMPQGGNLEIKYAEKYGTVDNPKFKYVMSSVTVNDGCKESVKNIDHGSHSLVTLYEYGNGWYDRNEKEFYGYDSVTTKTFTGIISNKRWE